MVVLITTLVLLASIFQGIVATTFSTPVSSTDGALITFKVTATNVTSSTLSWVVDGKHVANATVTVQDRTTTVTDVKVDSEFVYSATFFADECNFEVSATLSLKQTPHINGSSVMITDGVAQSQMQNASTAGNSGNIYSVTVFTGSQNEADTDATITLDIFGEFGNTGPIALKSETKDLFEIDQEDFFNLTSFNVGKIKKLVLDNDNTGHYPGWVLDKVVISDTLHGEALTFTCFAWLSPGDGYALTHTLYQGRNCSLTSKPAPCEVPTFEQLMCSGSDETMSRRCYRLSTNNCTDTLDCKSGTCTNGTTCDRSWNLHQCSRKCVIHRPGCDFMCEEECDERSDCPVNECEEGLHECDQNAGCFDETQDYICSCNDGYTGNGKTCEDIDECADKSHNCDKHAKCINEPGGFKCECKEGYIGDGTECCGFVVTKSNVILISAIVLILTAFLA